MHRGSPSSDKGHKLYVGGLLDSVRKQDVTDEFGKFGDLRDVWVARNPPGFAFVEFSKNADAERAVRALDGMNVCGSRIRVEFANVGGGKGGGNGSRRSGGGGMGSRGGRGGNRGGFRGNFNGNGQHMRHRSPGPMFDNGRRGRSPPPRAYGRSRDMSPRPPRGHRSPPRGYGYDMPGMYAPGPEAGFPYGLPPGYPMMPFLPPEDILRSLRGRSPMRGRSPPPPRRRSRSPMMMDRRRGGGGGPMMMRDRSPPGMRMGRRGPPQNGRMSPPPGKGPRRMSPDRKRSPLGSKPRRGR